MNSVLIFLPLRSHNSYSQLFEGLVPFADM